MFNESKAVASPNEDAGSMVITIDHGDPAVTPVRRASPHRLAELVHHLSDAPVSEAHRAIRRTDHTCDGHDPLTIVASALLQLRRDDQRLS